MRSQQWRWCSVGARVLQQGGSVDDGVMLLARCGTAAPSLSRRSTLCAVPLQGNEGGALGVCSGISSHERGNDGGGRPDVPRHGFPRVNLAQMTRIDEVNKRDDKAEMAGRLAGRRDEVVGSASSGADVVRAPLSFQSGPIQTQAPLSGRVPSTRTGDQLLPGHRVSTRDPKEGQPAFLFIAFNRCPIYKRMCFVLQQIRADCSKRILRTIVG